MTGHDEPRTSEEHIELVERHSAHNYHPLPVVVAEAEGVWVTDVEGKRYLDMLAAYSALNFGHRHPDLVRAAEEQLDRLTLTSRAFHNDQIGPFLRDQANPDNPKNEQNHWHAALGVYDCDRWAGDGVSGDGVWIWHPATPGGSPARAGNTNVYAGLHSHADGIIHMEPQVTEEAVTQGDLTIRASLAKVAASATPIAATGTEKAAAVPTLPPAVPAPVPRAELKVLRAPAEFAFCDASIGSSWTGSPFDGVTSIRLPAGRYMIRVRCTNQPARVGVIEVPLGKTERNFAEVVTLNPLSDSPGQQ